MDSADMLGFETLSMRNCPDPAFPFSPQQTVVADEAPPAQMATIRVSNVRNPVHTPIPHRDHKRKAQEEYDTTIRELEFGEEERVFKGKQALLLAAYSAGLQKDALVFKMDLAKRRQEAGHDTKCVAPIFLQATRVPKYTTQTVKNFGAANLSAVECIQMGSGDVHMRAPAAKVVRAPTAKVVRAPAAKAMGAPAPKLDTNAMPPAKKQRVLSPKHPAVILQGVQAMVAEVGVAAIPAKSLPVWMEVEREVGMCEEEYNKLVKKAKRHFLRAMDEYNNVPSKPRGPRKPKLPVKKPMAVDGEVSV